MITVTLDKDEYDKLVEYRDAYNKNSYLLITNNWDFGGVIVRLKSLSQEEAVSVVLTENKRLKAEIERLNNLPWWKKI